MNSILKGEQNITRFSVLTLMVVLTVIYRLMPHPWNLAPVGAVALFGGAYFGSTIIAILIPLTSLWIGDLILNNLIFNQYFSGFTLFYEGCGWQYGSFIVISLIGLLLRNNVKPLNVLLASLAGSLVFFLVSNFGVWMGGTMYPTNAEGLVACYIAALPFLKNTILGDLVFSAALFGAFEYLQIRYPKLKIA